jgi:hypothetical protein
MSRCASGICNVKGLVSSFEAQNQVSPVLLALQDKLLPFHCCNVGGHLIPVKFLFPPQGRGMLTQGNR